MSVCLLTKMLHILVLCPVLLIAGVQTLTIDSQLGTSVEDCFERISIGEQLPSIAIYRNVSELTTRECEQICKQDKQCQAYDYGVGAKGNATCDLSTESEKDVKEKSLLTRHPDYDVYVRRFQCEQSPPSPIQPLLDDPEESGLNSNDRPHHRPVFRPDVDERPLTDDVLVSSDIDPYNIGSKPISPYRPDDISQRPVFDVGPSYGDHKPQDIPYPERPRPDSYRPGRPDDPYRPNRPNDPYRPARPDSYRPDDPYRPENPQDPYRPSRPTDPYRPERPQGPYRPNRPERPQDPYRPQSDTYPQKPKPESNDVLHFDDYGKPKPEMDKPDPYRPEKPNYNYIIRPNRKPRPEDEYIKPNKPINNQYDYPSGPIGPPYKPNRPEKPAYSYNSQYASNYGQNSQNDNLVHVEIYDPPRPYIPIKDRPDQSYNQGFLGYGTYSSQNANSQSSQSQNSYTGTITEIGFNQNRPDDKPQKPYDQNDDQDKPGYGNKPSTGSNKGSYGQNDYNSQNGYSSQNGYGFHDNRPANNLQTGYQRPNDRFKPVNQNYGGNQNSLSGNQHTYSQNSYGSSNTESQSSYGSSYGESHRPYDHGEIGYQKPSYNKPLDNNVKGDYGGNQGYGNQQSYEGNQGYYYKGQSAYGNMQGSYGFQSGFGSGYGVNKGSYSSYGNHGSYGSNQASYGSNQASYGSNQGSYGSYDGYGSQTSNGYGNRPIYDYETHKPGYGNANPAYDSQKPGYGNQKPDYDSPKPGYGSQKPDYDILKPGYGSQKPDSDQKPGYDSQRPDYGSPEPGYGNQRPIYDQKPGYGNQRPDYDSSKPGYGSPKPDYDQKPGYGNQRPDYDRPKPGYGNQKPGYGNQKPDYDQKPGYGNDRPDPSYGSAESDSGYGKPSYSNDKLDLKPGYGNQKPGYGNQKPGYGNEKPDDTGYGPQSVNGTNAFRPDVRPVYEYEMDKPTNVPTYIARPGGEVVTSRPVVIGDYERPVYKDPGMSYAVDHAAGAVSRCSCPHEALPENQRCTVTMFGPAYAEIGTL